MTGLWMRIAGGALVVAGLLAMILYIQHLHGTVESQALRINEIETELAGKERSLKALQQSAIERQADNTRIDAAEKGLRDDLQRIERAIPEGAPRPVPDASSVAVTCRRLLRTGQTQSPEYRASCR